MPCEGYADPVTNNGPRFHLNMPVSELTEHVTRAIKVSDVSSAPPVAETAYGVMHETRPEPYQTQWGSWAQDAKTHRLRLGSVTPTRLIPRRARR